MDFNCDKNWFVAIKVIKFNDFKLDKKTLGKIIKNTTKKLVYLDKIIVKNILIK